MTSLILGLILFLGIHSLRIVADDARTAAIGRMGLTGYMLAYSAISIVGIVLLSVGYGDARASAAIVWTPPAGLRHLALVIVPVALVLVVAAYAPTGRIKSLTAHPMALGVALFGIAHLAANGSTADVLLFGGFFLWGAAAYVAALRRTTGKPAGGTGASLAGDAIAVVGGAALAALLILGAHRWLFGVSPLG